MPLAWMVGTWRGTGRGEYPTIQPFTFEQEVVFNHDGRNFLNYYSRTWILDDDGKVVGCHQSEADAKKQLAALYASEAKKNVSEFSDTIWDGAFFPH